MQSVQVKIQILIPAYNVVHLIDDTMQSIWKQNFDRENIYVLIADFGSSDGTYEKILSYDSYHLGIYRLDRDFTRNRMVSEVAKIAECAHPDIGYCYQIVLWPGDIIYPDYLSKLTQVMERYGAKHVNMVLSEVDVRNEDGIIVQRHNLYKEEKMLDGGEDYWEFVSKGYQHNIMCFGGEISRGNHRIWGERNNRTWWNKCAFLNFEKNVVYLPEHLGCVRECFYEDELQEVLLRWESLLMFRRFYESKRKLQLQMNDLENAECNVAHYALWRSFLMMDKGDVGQAKSCFLISGVICPDIKKHRIYMLLEHYTMKNDQSDYAEIREYFETDDRA